MDDRPQLSPDLRPLHYCPNCGERVAQQAVTCFMCGYSLDRGQRRRFSLPIGDLLLVVVILGVGYLWWTRGPEQGTVTAVAPTAVTSLTPSPPSTPMLTATPGGPSPTPTETPTITPTPTPHLYTVVRGDTIEKISLEFGIDVEDLMITNGLTSDLIRVDEVLVIPPGPLPRGPDGKPLPTATPTPVSAIFLVSVRANDTLEIIAKRLGASVEAIIEANDWVQNADTIIRPGDRLVVPVGTVLPQGTPLLQMSPTATPVPTFTPTPGSRWPGPHLIRPLEGTHFQEESVLLRWLSVGQLGRDEVYVVRVVPEGRRRQILTSATQGTSFRVPADWLLQQTRRGSRFFWTVQVARDIAASESAAGGLTASSPLSSVRSFVWEPGS